MTSISELGTKQDEMEEIIWQLSYKMNGEVLFKKPVQRKSTWISPDGRTRNKIGCIITDGIGIVVGSLGP